MDRVQSTIDYPQSTIGFLMRKPLLVFQEGLSEVLSRRPVLLTTKSFAHRAMVVMVVNEDRDD